MSWTWRDTIRDDSVWRFQPQTENSNFFQSGRHAAEERFWKLKIHEDGSFRNRNVSSMDNFYTIKEALRKDEEGLDVSVRREDSVEENSRKSTEPDSIDSSSSSSSESDSDLEEVRDGEIRRKKKKKPKKKVGRKVDSDDELTPEKARELRIRELERRELEKIRELERRERELEEKERELDRRSREQTPEYYYYYRSRRNSDVSSKDYPYTVASEYAPSIAPIQEENKSRRRNPNETQSTRYY